MSFTSFSPQAAVALVAFTFASLARGELPNLQPTQVLKPTRADIQPDPEQPPGEAAFGSDVVIKGNLALVGLPLAHDGAGRAAVFVRDATGKWIRRATLTPRDPAPGANFGKAVAVSGRRALVGSSTGVYVFERDANVWRQRQKLAIREPGRVSDMDFEGNIAVIGVGGPGGNNGAYAFHLRADGWFRAIGRILPSDVQATDQFGASVALSSSTVAITAPGYNNSQGAAYVFTCAETGCRQRQKLLANDGEAHDGFGSSVDVLGDTLVLGASRADPVEGDDLQPPSEQNFNAWGAAYVFVRSRSTGGEWVETQKLRITPQEHNWYYNLGRSIALSADRIVIGAPYGMTQFEPGKVFVYTRTGGTYVATHAMIGALGLGHDVSISSATVLSGAPQESLFRGEAHIYTVQ